MGEVHLERYTADDTTYYHHFTAFNPTIYDEYVLRFNNLLRHNALHPDGFPGQETLVMATNGGDPDLGNVYTTGAIWYGSPPASLAPITEFINAPTGSFFTVDCLPPPHAGISGWVRIYSPGVISGVSLDTTFMGHIIRYDGSGNPHISLYNDRYSGNPGGKITKLVLVNDLLQDPTFTFKAGYVDLYGVTL